MRRNGPRLNSLQLEILTVWILSDWITKRKRSCWIQLILEWYRHTILTSCFVFSRFIVPNIETLADNHYSRDWRTRPYMFMQKKIISMWKNTLSMRLHHDPCCCIIGRIVPEMIETIDWGIGPLDIYATLIQNVRRRIYVHPTAKVQAAENTIYYTQWNSFMGFVSRGFPSSLHGVFPQRFYHGLNRWCWRKDIYHAMTMNSADPTTFTYNTLGVTPEAIVDESLRRQNLRRKEYIYNVGTLSGFELGIQGSLILEAMVLSQCSSFTNGTVDILLQPNVRERTSIQCLATFPLPTFPMN